MQMKLILREDVPALGKAGDVVDVRRGYGRNYLVPQGKAVMATRANLRELEHERNVALTAKAKKTAQARGIADKLNAQSLTIARKVGETEKLFGSVTALDIAEALAAQGLAVDRHLIHLPEPIKSLGHFEVEVKLHGEVSAKVKVTVVPEKQP
jgi:large subunit ribosomal protein L9